MENKKFGLTPIGWILIAISILLFVGGLVFIISDFQTHWAGGYGAFAGFVCIIFSLMFLSPAILSSHMEVSKKIKAYIVFGWIYLFLGLLVGFAREGYTIFNHSGKTLDLFFLIKKVIFSSVNLLTLIGLFMFWRAHKIRTTANKNN